MNWKEKVSVYPQVYQSCSIALPDNPDTSVIVAISIPFCFIALAISIFSSSLPSAFPSENEVSIQFFKSR